MPVIHFVQHAAQPLAARAVVRGLAAVHAARGALEATAEPLVVDGHVEPDEELPDHSLNDI